MDRSSESSRDLEGEVEELRASRERLVLRADVESQAIERELHDGVQQHLVVLAVNLQRTAMLVAADPGAAKTLLDEMARDVQTALDETARLAERIHAPLSTNDGRLAAALRSAAVSAGVPASVELSPLVSSCPPEVARTVLLCWNEALDHGASGARPTIAVGEEDDALVFEIVSGAPLGQLRDRVEALGGRLVTEPMPDGMTRASGSLPLSRRP
jgi:signal transduction histidine kinase